MSFVFSTVMQRGLLSSVSICPVALRKNSATVMLLLAQPVVLRTVIIWSPEVASGWKHSSLPSVVFTIVIAPFFDESTLNVRRPFSMS